VRVYQPPVVQDFPLHILGDLHREWNVRFRSRRASLHGCRQSFMRQAPALLKHSGVRPHLVTSLNEFDCDLLPHDAVVCQLHKAERAPVEVLQLRRETENFVSALRILERRCRLEAPDQQVPVNDKLSAQMRNLPIGTEDALRVQ